MGLFDLLGWLIIGLIIGLLARLLVPGPDPMGCVATSLLGIAGSFVGGFLGNLFFHAPHNDITYARPGFFMSLIGAVIVLVIVRALRHRP